MAYDDAGVPDKQPHLTRSSGNRNFTESNLPDESLRTCAFGECVEFAHAGLNPQAAYKAVLRFFSDGTRQVRVIAGK